MSESGLKDDIRTLIDVFKETKVLEHYELDDEDIADILWLAVQMGEVELSQDEKDQGSGSSVEVEIQESAPSEFPSPSEPTAPLVSDQSIQKTAEPAPVKGLPFNAPAAPALLNVLQMGRSLRPLMRKVPSLTQEILDEEATVNQVAERDVWLPVTKPEPERWLDLELVVEESKSAFIWKETVDELRQVFETQGAFRNVRVWSVSSSESQKLELTRWYATGRSSRRQHSHRELIHPSQRGVVVLISDCTSSIWQNATIHQWLKEWSDQGPTAILQLFPERLWNSTQLGTGRKLFSTALSPGVANPHLVLKNLPMRARIDEDKALVLPVMTLEPRLLNDWARVVSGAGNARIPTFLFDLEFVQKQRSAANGKQPSIDLSAENRVDRFMASSSAVAQQLAGMMAAAPVEIPVVNLIRKTLLPEAASVHVAEVYMGGLLYSSNSEGQEPVYQFYDGVRQELNDRIGRRRTVAVLDAISEYIAEKIDRSIRNFRALLRKWSELEQEQQNEILPFAQVAVEVLNNLGGEYAEFAKEVAPTIPGIELPSTTEDQTAPEPEHRMESFEVGLIEFDETATFKFDVATLVLENRRELFGLIRNKKWVIRKQRQQAYRIVDNLGEGITLELVEIPAGKFLMGSPEDEPERYDDESPQHEVNVSGFLMGRYPITQAQWRTVVNRVPTIQRELNPDPSGFKGNDQPVEQVSWYDAVEFCARLSQLTGENYRLPSEAEWEYACRAGTTTPFHFGENITTDLANYSGRTYGDGPEGKSRGQTTPVGSFKVANAFGLYDMHGNVWEWCADPWHENYEDAPTDGSVWDENDNRYQTYNNDVLVNFLQDERTRVCRGGSWITNPRTCRSTSRDRRQPDYTSLNAGFRVVRGGPRILP